MKIIEALQIAKDALDKQDLLTADIHLSSILKKYPNHIDANYYLGKLAVLAGQPNKSLKHFEIVLSFEPTSLETLTKYVEALILLGDINSARAAYKNAKENGLCGILVEEQGHISIFDDKTADTHNRGIIHSATINLDYIFSLLDDGNIQSLIKLVEQVFPLSLKSATLENIFNACLIEIITRDTVKKSLMGSVDIDIADPNMMYSLGHAYLNNNHDELAGIAFLKVIQLNPNHSLSFLQLGALFQNKREYNQAKWAYIKSLELNPNLKESHNNVGVIFLDSDNKNEAIFHFIKALQIDPEFLLAQRNLIRSVKHIAFKSKVPGILNFLDDALRQKGLVRPKDVEKAIVSLLKFEPFIIELLEANNQHYDALQIEALAADLDKIPALLQILSIAPITDLDFESFLVILRAEILKHIHQIDETAYFITLLSTLAQQCFLNEYVYPTSEAEQIALFDLETHLSQSFREDAKLNKKLVLCLASYQSLDSCDFAPTLKSNPTFQRFYTNPGETLEKSNQLIDSKQNTVDTQNHISAKVKAQYEDNPYPRWIDFDSSVNKQTLIGRSKEIKLKINHHPTLFEQNPKILVAGCGTGQHALSVASRIEGAQVTAIDLSYASLAYAKRKAAEFEINNIDFLQCDILDLGKIDKVFHSIECVGVLHHMETPSTGLARLYDKLIPGGLIKLGLYSTLARQHIAKLRDDISLLGLSSSKHDIISFRERVKSSSEKKYELIKLSQDFYTLSSVRDLLFHEQEHCFDIDGLQVLLDKVNLRFCGFENSLTTFKEQFPDPESEYILRNWREFEEQNPRFFASMYQFWAQK